MGLINRIKKHYAVKSYVLKLPGILKKNYGKHKKYNESQVRKAIQKANLNCDYIAYAMAMYISKNEFESLLKKNTLNGDYDVLRHEVADSFFDGKANFTIHDVLDASTQGDGMSGGLDGFDGGSMDASDGDSD